MFAVIYLYSFTDLIFTYFVDLFFFVSALSTQEGATALQLAISNQLPLVVDAICTRGADMSVVNDNGDPPLWLALDSNLEDIASTLVCKTHTAFTRETRTEFKNLQTSAARLRSAMAVT